ncbi:MAG: hypothetical protein J6V48_03790 [Clostridia bacterium]|nr:hypothetical protein [Clostridia bacterium]
MTNMTGTDKTQNARRYMRFGIILAAPFFLFNPVYAVIDPLPDWIGYVILCVALSRFCDVNGHFDSAHRSFFRLALVDALKPFSVIVIFAGMDLSERSTMMLLATFVSAVVELLLAVPGFNDLFEGITVFSESGGGTEALKGARTRTVRIMTTVFLIVREALACLPEFAVLSGQGYDDSRFDWSVFTAFFRTAAIMLCFVAGIVWLVSAVGYFSKICSDGEFFEAAAGIFRERIADRPGVQIRRRIGFILIFFSAFFLLSADFQIDGMNVIPDLLCAAAGAGFFLTVRRLGRRWIDGTVMSFVYAVLAAVSWFFSYRFHSVYNDYEVQRSAAAWNAFMKYYPFDVASNILFAAVALLMIVRLSGIAADHCGYLSASASEEYRENRRLEILRSVAVRMRVCGALTVLSAAAGIAYPWVTTLKDLVIGRIFWAVHLVLSLILFVASLSAYYFIKSECDARYMLD